MIQQPTPTTINPAGGPKVTETREGKPYMRDTFIRDLRKVAKKTESKKA